MSGKGLTMSYTVMAMSEIYAQKIIKWKYKGILSIYNFKENDETINELLTKEYYVVLDTKAKIVGYFCTGESAIVPKGKKFGVYDDTSFVDIGIGLSPRLIGKGKGYPFFMFCLDYIRKMNNNRFRLTVLDFNKRAIHIYHKAGFIIDNYFKSDNEKYYLVMILLD